MENITSTPLFLMASGGLGVALIIIGGLIGWTPTRLALLSLFGRKPKRLKKRAAKNRGNGGRVR